MGSNPLSTAALNQVAPPQPELNVFQKMMESVGLNQPGLRFLTLFTLTDLAVWLMKPPYLFEPDGSVNSKALIPWWAPGVVVGGIASIFL